MFDRTLPDRDTMYHALVARDSGFEGIFIAAVTTTGVFCRPTCGARKPKPEHVVFFPSTRDALLAGYRPCKLCRPMTTAGAMPEAVRRLLEEVDADPSLRLRDADLRARGLEPAGLRRLFLRTHGMTFQAYLRARRIAAAFGAIRDGETVDEAAAGHGWESVSAFRDAFARATGTPPGRANVAPVLVTRIETPLGPAVAGASERGICLLEFADRRMLETQVRRLERIVGAPLLPGTSPLLAALARELDDYFAGRLRDFAVPLDLRGTPFQTRVWEELRTIPFGITRSYGEQARRLGDPGAVRAVARANGDNRIAIAVPCHRVIGADGSLTGYGGGLWRKRWLLDRERAALAGEVALATRPAAER